MSAYGSSDPGRDGAETPGARPVDAPDEATLAVPPPPAVDRAAAVPPADPPPGSGPTAADPPPFTPAVEPPPAAAPPADPPPVTPPPGDPGAAGAGRGRGRVAAERTAEGARVVGGRVSQAATATAQALRETDVREIAHSTTSLIETARPFFLAGFAVLFALLAWAEDTPAVGVVFALGAVVMVLAAAFSLELDRGLARRRGRRDPRR